MISIFNADIHAFRPVVPFQVDSHNGLSGSQWNGKGGFSEDANRNVASVPQQQIKRQQYSQDYNWRPQMGSKIISRKSLL
jgi:hypothetical protein